MIALQRDETLVGLGEERHFAKFAFRNARVEVIAAENVFKIFYAVDFVFAFFARDEQADMIPFANRFGRVKNFTGGRIQRRLVERIEPAATLMVGGLDVVFELKFRTSCPSVVARIGDMKHDAAITSLRNIVVEL